VVGQNKLKKTAIVFGIVIGITGIGLIVVSDQTRCEITGGYWGFMSSEDPTKSCNPSTSDAGKECTDSSQCEGFCKAEEGLEIYSEATGICSQHVLYAGCTWEIKNGLVEPPWCF